MKKLNTFQTRLLIIIAVAIFPFISFSQDDSFGQKEAQPRVTNVKKITRYSLSFDVDLPTFSDVLEYMSEDLGIQVQNLDELTDPNWNPSAFDTRNYRISQNEDGVYEVQVRFYPPVDPMSVENVADVQKDSRILCTETVELLKAERIN